MPSDRFWVRNKEKKREKYPISSMESLKLASAQTISEGEVWSKGTAERVL